MAHPRASTSDPMRIRLAISIAGKVSGQLCAGFTTPGPPGVLEIADHFLLLRIHANCRLVSLQERAPLAGQIAHLQISVGILSFATFLAIVVQRLADPLRPADWVTGRRPHDARPVSDQSAESLLDPLGWSCG